MLTLHAIYLLLAKWGVLIFQRAAAFTGSLYLYRRGRRTGLKRYYAAAAATYVGSWLIFLLMSYSIWRHWLPHPRHP